MAYVIGIGALLVVLPMLAVVLVVLSHLGLFIQAKSSGVEVSMVELVTMRLRGLSPVELVEHFITLSKAGVEIDMPRLEAHCLAGGNLDNVADAVVSASKSGLQVDFERLAAIDLAGRDVRQAVASFVQPTLIECPAPGQPIICGVAQDGVRLSINVRVTVRTCLERLVGGANEETVAARVGEGIVAVIGKSASHKTILENPDTISRYILSRGLDSGTAFEIVSVDVADTDIVDNVGARLATEQAAADTQVAQAKAEMRRMAARAREQEMRARVREMSIQETAAQSNVPLAAAAALGNGLVCVNPRPVRPTFGRLRWAGGNMG